MAIVFLLLFPALMISGIQCDNNVILQTKLGEITGVSSSLNVFNASYNYTVYKRIPYAKPPIGQLRFRKPVPYVHWNGTLDATHFGPSCIQLLSPEVKQTLPNLNLSEDCLFLNIYVPSTASLSNRKSVMVWIHGGSYATGQGMLYDGFYLSTIGDVVVVTINYRLNIFGFFATSDGSSAGNYGLWDQKLAIHWVKNNIDSFGGDPKSITIFGESAGAFSVGLHSIIPENRGLFHRVIAQSGTSLSAMSSFPRTTSDKVAQYFNCTREFTTDLLACMQKKDSGEMFRAIMQSYTSHLPDFHLGLPFTPVIDGDLLKEDPLDIIQNRNSSAYSFYKSLDMMIGTNSGEGSLLIRPVEYLKQFISFNLTEGIASDFLCKYVFPTLSADMYNNDAAISQSLCQEYSSNGSLPEQGRKAVEFYGDIFFYYPAVQSLNSHASNNHHTKQYQYLSKQQTFLSPVMKTYPWFKGAGHASELPMLFPFRTVGYLNLKVIKYWTNFAKTGDVNGPGLATWPQYDTVTRKYIVFADTGITIENSLYKNRMEFWSSLMKKDTSPSTTACTRPDCTFG